MSMRGALSRWGAKAITGKKAALVEPFQKFKSPSGSPVIGKHLDMGEVTLTGMSLHSLRLLHPSIVLLYHLVRKVGWFCTGCCIYYMVNPDLQVFGYKQKADLFPLGTKNLYFKWEWSFWRDTNFIEHMDIVDEEYKKYGSYMGED